MGTSSSSVAIVGAGLAGSEAALILAQRGIPVVLYEMRPGRMTPAHKTDKPAELVCSNSLKSVELPTAPGILKAELSLLGSPLLATAEKHRVPAGSALAVDREKFSRQVHEHLSQNPLVTVKHSECSKPPEDSDYCIIASGPLTSESLTTWLQQTFSAGSLYFYDAIAPILSADSINMDIAFYASRYGKGSADYCNCPFTEEEYRAFYDALIAADRVKARNFEHEKFFEACLPVEVVAQRGYNALPFGTLRPVGLENPRTGKRAFAVCQLRKENAAGENLSMVGFQTRMTIPEQKRIIQLIPGLEKAEFLRYGSIHRNTYLQSPKLLAKDMSFRRNTSLFLAGQICGNEGYTESITTGHFAALFVWARIKNKSILPPPPTTACGALLKHVTQSSEKEFIPSNVNFGIFEPLPDSGKRKLKRTEKREKMCERALQDIEVWIKENL